MSKYATEQKFDGTVASLGRIVIVAVSLRDRELTPVGTRLVSGIIARIGDDDVPYIKLFDESGDIGQWKFVATKIPQLMEPGTWTWPPRT